MSDLQLEIYIGLSERSHRLREAWRRGVATERESGDAFLFLLTWTLAGVRGSTGTPPPDADRADTCQEGQ